jgi:hypothetical protein
MGFTKKQKHKGSHKPKKTYKRQRQRHKKSHKSKNYKHKQYAGFHCALDNNENVYVMLGHACDTRDEEEIVPPNCMYITKAVCTFSASSIGEQFIHDFFKKNEIIRSPCKNITHFIETPNNMMSPTYNAIISSRPKNKHAFNIHFNHELTIPTFYSGRQDGGAKPLPIKKTYRNAMYICFSDLVINTEPNVYHLLIKKSGLYKFGKTPRPYIDKNIIHTMHDTEEKLNNTILTEEDITKIYEDSIYPPIEEIIHLLDPVTNTIKYIDFKRKIRRFNISQKQLFESYREGIFYNILCRNDCNDVYNPSLQHRLTRQNSEIIRNELQEMVIHEEQQPEYKERLDKHLQDQLTPLPAQITSSSSRSTINNTDDRDE